MQVTVLRDAMKDDALNDRVARSESLDKRKGSIELNIVDHFYHEGYESSQPPRSCGPLIDCYLDTILSASVLSIIILLYIPIEATVIVVLYYSY